VISRRTFNVMAASGAVSAMTSQFSRAADVTGVVKANGYCWLGEEGFLKDFAGDLRPARARALDAVQGRGADALVTARTTKAAWRVMPTFYQVSTEDRTINPELERYLANRMNARTIELASK
jgi:hypothetical protein